MIEANAGRAWALMMAASLSWAGASEAVTAQLSLEAPPRDFGYVIGDVIRLEAQVLLDSPAHLIIGALPKPGPVNAWLQLRNIETIQEPGKSAGPLRLVFEYQSFYAALAPLRLTIPPVILHFESAVGPAEAQVPPWSFTMTPLHEARADQGVLAETLRPDAAPALAAPWSDWAALTLGFALLAVSAGYLAYLQGFMPYWSRGRHFALACSELRRLKGCQDRASAWVEAYRLVHRAFNGTIGETLFFEDLDRFFQRYPRYLPVREQVEAFFRDSYERFFAQYPDRSATPPLEGLISLCRQCLRIERGAS